MKKSFARVVAGILSLVALQVSAQGAQQSKTQPAELSALVKQKSMEQCQRELKSMWQTHRDQPVSFAFPVTRIHPKSPNGEVISGHHTVKVQAQMDSKFADGKVHHMYMECTIGVANENQVYLVGLNGIRPEELK